ncbi:hypothetical protein, partial [Streptomyces shenzhenensis]|uniref:hypothetical protein n=1 Tax=Streptomyces shenzhenensis TaxID=943815 RepID=UPI0033CD5870
MAEVPAFVCHQEAAGAPKAVAFKESIASEPVALLDRLLNLGAGYVRQRHGKNPTQRGRPVRLCLSRGGQGCRLAKEVGYVGLLVSRPCTSIDRIPRTNKCDQSRRSLVADCLAFTNPALVSSEP